MVNKGRFFSSRSYIPWVVAFYHLWYSQVLSSSTPATVQHRQITRHTYTSHLFCGEIWVIKKVPTWQQSWVFKSFTRGSLVLVFNVPKSLLFVDFQPSLTSFLPKVWADISEGWAGIFYPLGPQLPFPISLMVPQQLSTTTYLSQNRPDCPFKEPHSLSFASRHYAPHSIFLSPKCFLNCFPPAPLLVLFLVCLCSCYFSPSTVSYPHPVLSRYLLSKFYKHVLLSSYSSVLGALGTCWSSLQLHLLIDSSLR